MSTDLEIPFSGFFRADETPAAFAEMLTRCLSENGVLSAAIGEAGVTLRLTPPEDPAQADTVRLWGQWRTPDTVALSEVPGGARLLLPLFFRCTRLDLPRTALTTMGRDYRALADFFVRNLFLALGRADPVVCTVDGASGSEARQRAVKDLQKQYFFIFKTAFPEPAFDGLGAVDAIDMVVTGAYVPAPHFDNPLLRLGRDDMRRAVLEARRQQAAAVRRDRVLAARAAMMEQY